MLVTRLRQVVVVAHDRDATEAAFVRDLGLGEAFHDPGVGEFGLVNAVCPVADVFVEVVSPKTDGSVGSGASSAAGRHLARYGGDGGYMVIFQVEDIVAARSHLGRHDVRLVWNADSASIGASHAHPSDIGGAIVSFDQPHPPSSWLWGGPGWEARSTDAASGFSAIEIASHDPGALFSRWCDVLNVEGDALNAARRSFVLPDGVSVSFREPDASGRSGLVRVALRAEVSRPSVRIAGVDFSVTS